MNVLFLLLTSVSAGDVVQAAPPAGPVVSTAIPGGCGAGGCGAGGGCASSCDSCCEEKKPGFCARMKARFRKSECESCAPTCAAPACAAPTCAPACAPTCAASSCDSCCEEKKPSFMERLRAKCHKKDKAECCPSTCDTCGSGCGSASGGCAPAAGTIINAPATGTPAMPGKAIEPIKKMPKDEGKGALMSPIVPVVPVTPAGARIEADAKSPF